MQPSENLTDINKGSEMTEHEIVDTKGKVFKLMLFRFLSRGENHFEQDSRLAPFADSIREVLRLAFKDDDSQANATKSRFKYVATDDALDIIIDKDIDGKEIVAGLHSYRAGVLPDYDNARYLYTHYSAVHPSYQGRNLRRIAGIPMIDTFKPDIFAGSTHSASIYESIVKMSTDTGRVLFPRPGQIIPEAILHIGKAILREALGGEYTASLDKRLIRTGSSPYTKDSSDRPYPFFDNELNLLPSQSVFYVGVTPQLEAKLLSR